MSDVHVDKLIPPNASEEATALAVAIQIALDAEAIQQNLGEVNIPRNLIEDILGAWVEKFLRATSKTPTGKAIVTGTTANIDAICRLTNERLEQALLEAAHVEENLRSGLDMAAVLTEVENSAQESKPVDHQSLEAVCKTIIAMVESAEHPVQQPATPTEIIGYLLRVLTGKRFTELFKTELKFEASLLAHDVPGIRREFARSQHELSPNLSVETRNDSCQISDQGSNRSYLIRKGQDTLTVYYDAGPLNKKPFVREQCLVDWIERVFGGRDGYIVGGASATIANALAQRGETNVALLARQFSPILGGLFHENTKVLVKDDSGVLNLRTARTSGRLEDLIKVHCPVEWEAEQKLSVCGLEFKAAETDRVIFRTARWWNKSRKTWAADWKPGFAHCGLDKEQVEELAHMFKGAILSGLQYVPDDPGLLKLVNDELEILHRHGVKLHVELSGVTKGAAVFLNEMVKGRVLSLGIGDELVPVLEALGITPDKSNTAYADYDNAKRLASELKLERLYVHRPTADVILRKRTGTLEKLAEDLEAEVLGDLHAKYVTVWWLRGGGVGRDVPKLTGLLRREGLLDLFDFATRLGRELGLNGVELEKRVKEICGQGWYLPESLDDEYGVAVVPVKWTYGVKNLITTSVGDLSSGFSFVHCNYVDS